MASFKIIRGRKNLPKPRRLRVGEVVIERICYLDGGKRKCNLYEIRKRTKSRMEIYDAVGIDEAKKIAKKIAGKNKIIKIYTY